MGPGHGAVLWAGGHRAAHLPRQGHPRRVSTLPFTHCIYHGQSSSYISTPSLLPHIYIHPTALYPSWYALYPSSSPPSLLTSFPPSLPLHRFSDGESWTYNPDAVEVLEGLAVLPPRPDFHPGQRVSVEADLERLRQQVTHCIHTLDEVDGNTIAGAHMMHSIQESAG